MSRSIPVRSFDPVAVGRSECAAWAAYYRRDWPGVLRGAVAMVHHGFGLGPATTLLAAWHVFRANQAWAPFPVNRPAAARRHMARFYRLVSDAGRLSVNPSLAAELEVTWWEVHRARQHHRGASDEQLVEALVALYAYVYQADESAVRPAAQQRVLAMQLSDAWVAAGCRLSDPTLAMERMALVASYSALRDASDRGALRHG
jgi:hypothetical protein